MEPKFSRELLDISFVNQLPANVTDIFSKFHSAGFDIWLVGGGVRNLLTGKPIVNPDFTTNAIPEKIQELFPDSFYDNSFGTVGMTIDDQLCEITTYRTERNYSDRRHPDQVSWGKTLEEDLPRREFTISSIVIGLPAEASARAGQLFLVDPFAGRHDLDQKIVKAVGDPAKRFGEDALRMIRAIRIATQLDFVIEDTTLQAIKQFSQTIKAVSWERIRDELMKIIASAHPTDGIKLLDATDLLREILPEMLPMKQVPQGGHHIYDVWTHSLESLHHCPSSDPLIRLAALLHDIGKPQSARREGPRGITFYGHEVIGARLARAIAARLRFSKKDTDKLVTLIRWHMFTYDPKMTDAAIRRFIRRVGIDNINDMMLLRVGDRKGGGSKATSWRLRELQERIGQQLYQPLTINDLKVDGHDVMKVLKISPGPQVGKILNALFEEVLEDSSKNTRNYLLTRIRDLASSSQTTSRGAAVKVEE